MIDADLAHDFHRIVEPTQSTVPRKGLGATMRALCAPYAATSTRDLSILTQKTRPLLNAEVIKRPPRTAFINESESGYQAYDISQGNVICVLEAHQYALKQSNCVTPDIATHRVGLNGGGIGPQAAVTETPHLQLDGAVHIGAMASM